jgi:ribonuclease HI
MELLGVISALEALKGACAVTVYTDSRCVQTGISTWICIWKANGWRTAKRAPVKNQDLWMRLDSLTSQHTIEWKWECDHNGHTGNEAADILAQAAAGN